MKTIKDFALSLSADRFSKIAVLTGAGISVNAGIPDFRSKNGLYSKLSNASQIFNIDYFRKDPSLFYTHGKHLLAGHAKPTPAHYFIRILELQNMLSICYTQNIDGLEAKAGITRVVQAHGNINKAHCVKCFKEHDQRTVEQHMNNGVVLYCPCGGPVKADVVFFGEALPEEFHKNLKHIFEADLLIVIGTSLAVFPFAELVTYSVKAKRVVINKENLDSFEDIGFDFSGENDSIFVGDCDDVCLQVAAEAGWEETMKKLRSEM